MFLKIIPEKMLVCLCRETHRGYHLRIDSIFCCDIVFMVVFIKHSSYTGLYNATFMREYYAFQELTPTPFLPTLPISCPSPFIESLSFPR